MSLEKFRVNEDVSKVECYYDTRFHYFHAGKECDHVIVDDGLIPREDSVLLDNGCLRPDWNSYIFDTLHDYVLYLTSESKSDFYVNGCKELAKVLEGWGVTPPAIEQVYYVINHTTSKMRKKFAIEYEGKLLFL